MTADAKQQLRVRPALPPPEKQKISFKLPVPTISSFETYLSAFAERYGVDADPDFVANEIFTAFFESDRVFASYLKIGPAAFASLETGGKSSSMAGEGNHK